MQRKFLENLGLEQDAINQIMSENGKDVENARKSEAGKFDAERQTLTQQAADLQGQIDKRDGDIKDLQDRLTDAQTDASKLTEVQTQLTTLQTQYEADRNGWAQKQAQQAYEFAVKTKANELRFSSGAAKKDFIREAIAAGLKMDGDTILGYNDFVDKYKAGDPEAIITPEPTPEPGTQTGENGEGGGEVTPPTPEVVLPTGNNPSPNGATFGFNFHGVRPKPKE